MIFDQLLTTQASICKHTMHRQARGAISTYLCSLSRQILAAGAGPRPLPSQQVELQITLTVDGREQYADKLHTFRLGEGDVCSGAIKRNSYHSYF